MEVSNCSTSVRTIILLLQKLRQPHGPSDEFRGPSTPRLCIWNNRLHLPGEKEIQTNSLVTFSFEALIQDSKQQPFQPAPDSFVAKECEEDLDIDVLYARRSRTALQTPLLEVRESDPFEVTTPIPDFANAV